MLDLNQALGLVACCACSYYDETSLFDDIREYIVTIGPLVLGCLLLRLYLLRRNNAVTKLNISN